MSDEKKAPKKVDKKDAERLLRDVMKLFQIRYPMYKHGLFSGIDGDVEFYALMWEEVGITEPFPYRIRRQDA